MSSAEVDKHWRHLASEVVDVVDGGVEGLHEADGVKLETLFTHRVAAGRQHPEEHVTDAGTHLEVM